MEKLKFEVKVTDVQKMNPLFSKCKIYVMYVGDNRNGSAMSKEAVMNALPTLYNCPIIGEYNETLEDFKGHGGKVEITSDGIQYIQTTKPYGVIPESSTFSWENIMDAQGMMKEYLVADGYLWTGRYPEAMQVVEQGKGQSMEIENCLGEYRADGVFQIDEFTFSALCILGNDVEPCFEDAKVVGYSLDKDRFKTEFSQMVTELKESLKESGEDMEDEVIVVEEVVATEEQFEETPVEETPVEEVVVEETPAEETEEVIEEVVEEVVEEVPAEETPVEEVVVVEETPVEETPVDKEAEFQAMSDKLFEVNTELVTLQAKYTALEVEVVGLREYKNTNELAKEKTAKDELIAEFSIGLNADEMKPVMDKAEELSLADMKVKLNEIFTAKNLATLKKKFSKDSSEEVIVSDLPKKDVPKSRYAV